MASFKQKRGAKLCSAPRWLSQCIVFVLERIADGQVQPSGFVVGRAVVDAQRNGVVEANNDELHGDA